MTRKTTIATRSIVAAGLLSFALAIGSSPALADPLPTRGLEERLARLAAENADLLGELARYRAGLERAVAELNRLRALRLRDVPAERSRSSRGARILSVARVGVAGRRATVSGTVRNDDVRVIRGELLIELLRDGHPVDAVRLPFVAASASHTPYAHAFDLEGYAAGSYAARAEFEEIDPLGSGRR